MCGIAHCNKDDYKHNKDDQCGKENKQDHKLDDSTRPVVTGCDSNMRGVVNTVGEFIESVANGTREPFEVISTEDNLFRITKANDEIRVWKDERLKKI